MHLIIKRITANANSGCLGATSRGRTHTAAILVGEVPKTIDPAVSEWRNPFRRSAEYFVRFNLTRGVPGELKHLSTRWKINHRDSVSSGERKRKSLNPAFGGGLRDASRKYLR